MREFEHPNMTGGFECPICKSGNDAPVVLIGMPGTEEDNNMIARQVHTECYKIVCKMHNIPIEIEPFEKEGG